MDSWSQQCPRNVHTHSTKTQSVLASFDADVFSDLLESMSANCLNQFERIAKIVTAEICVKNVWTHVSFSELLKSI